MSEMRDRVVRRRAFGKINLTLDVGQVRPDGFHQVTMVMQTVGIWDEIAVFKRDDDEITFDCNLPFLGASEKNIAFRAARVMKDAYRLSQGVHIRLLKKIPIAAGLAGGSADAAAVIKAMNRLFSLNLSMEEMMKIGEGLGSDIPFCLLGGTCLATERGERVRRITPMQETHVVLVKPDFGISTPWSYSHFEPDKVIQRVDTDGMMEAIQRGELEDICGYMVNHLERAALEEYPVIGSIKQDLVDLGAVGAMMTGSGPTVFGLFKEYETAREAARRCKSRYPWRYQVLYCRIDNPKKLVTL